MHDCPISRRWSEIFAFDPSGKQSFRKSRTAREEDADEMVDISTIQFEDSKFEDPCVPNNEYFDLAQHDRSYHAAQSG
jgi:hypothetical protein